MTETVQAQLDDAVLDGKPAHPGRRLTEDEFVAWCDDKTHAERVDGEVVVVSPVHLEHDGLGGFLRAWLALVAGRGRPGIVPGFAVRSEWFWQGELPDLLDIVKRLGIGRSGGGGATREAGRPTAAVGRPATPTRSCWAASS